MSYGSVLFFFSPFPSEVVIAGRVTSPWHRFFARVLARRLIWTAKVWFTFFFSFHETKEDAPPCSLFRFQSSPVSLECLIPRCFSERREKHAEEKKQILSFKDALILNYLHPWAFLSPTQVYVHQRELK